MSNKIFEVKMLGSFSLAYDGRDFVVDRNVVSKMTQLLQIALLNLQDGIPKLTLQDILYGRNEVENPNNSLNNTLFRLRQRLKSAGLSENSNFIIIRNGMCFWDEEVPVHLDVLEFEQLIRQAEEEADEDRKAELYQRAFEVYKGELLPSMIGESWIAVENERLRKLYFQCVAFLCRWLRNKERYNEGYEVTKIVTEIYPFDDWQIEEIDFLIAMNRYREAMDVYEKTAKRLFDEFGSEPSQEMLKRFRMMGEKVSQASGAIEDIKNRLSEKERRDGAYFCTFPSFIDTYHVFLRMMERNKLSVYLMLCTMKEKRLLTNAKNEKFVAAFGVLSKAIQASLRKGDFYTRYNSTQYIIMLIDVDQESCNIVSDRIQKNFHQNVKGSYETDFYVASVGEVYLSQEEGLKKRNDTDR